MIPVGVPYQRLDHSGGRVMLTDTEVRPATTTAKAVIAPSHIGVCRSDLRELNLDRFSRRDFGHEIVACVVGVSEGVPITVGQRVVFDPHPSLRSRTSGFGELVELEGEADALNDALVPLRDGINVEQAVFAEPLACACHCIRRLEAVTAEFGLDCGAPVGVVGAGIAGALIAAGLHSVGVSTLLVNRGNARLNFLRERGFLPEPILAGTADWSRFDRVVLATAFAEPHVLQIALNLMRPGGLLLLFAGTRPGMVLRQLDLDYLRRRELSQRVDIGDVIVSGTYGALRHDFERAFDLLQSGVNGEWRMGTAVERLVAEHISLDRAVAVLPKYASSGFIGKPLIVPDLSRRTAWL